MRIRQGAVTVSATDLPNPLSCRHLTTLDLHLAKGEIAEPAWQEPGAIKRLMLRYATREEEVDRLLRGKVLVDLHTITKQTVRASVEQYALKDIEKFYDYRRRVPLPDANQARHFVEHQLELSPSPALTDEALATVAGYTKMIAERQKGFEIGSKACARA